MPIHEHILLICNPELTPRHSAAKQAASDGTTEPAALPPTIPVLMNQEPTTHPSGRPPMAAYDFDERPFLVFWEITRACALACSHCRAEAQARRHPDELDPAEAKHLISQLAELAPPMLILTGGDPLMRRDAFDLAAELANELGDFGDEQSDTGEAPAAGNDEYQV